MTEQFGKTKELREQFIRAVYHLRDPSSGWAMEREIKERMGLDPDDFRDDDDAYVSTAQYFDQLGFIERQADGYGIVSITARGMQYVEGDLQPQQSMGNVTFNVQNAYGSIFGTQQNAEMSNVSFDFSTVEAELERAEAEIERRGGRDESELRALVAEVRAAHENGEPLDKGHFAKYLGVIQRNGWIAAPIAGTLLSIVTGA
jgi:hypothetical protein